MRIGPSNPTAIFIVCIGVIMMAAGIALAAFGYIILALVTFAPGAVFSAFTAPSLGHVHDLFWNEEGIEGPSGLFGLTLNFERTRIRWEDIVTTGMTRTQYWFVEARDGRRIFWNYLYPGYGALWNRLIKECPDVDDLSAVSLG